MESRRLGRVAKKPSEQNVFLAIGVQKVSRGSIMIELAHDARGGALSVPARAAGWRVRRMEPHGPPQVAYGRNGRPLRLALAATAHDLHREVRRPGRYRLDLLDARGRALPRAQPAFAQIREGTACPPAPKTEIEREIESLRQQLRALVTAVLEVARRNTELARLVVRRFPHLMKSAAGLLRAAADAALTARAMLIRRQGTAATRSEGPAAEGATPTLHLTARVARGVEALAAPATRRPVPQERAHEAGGR
jgi:hypothetical protein